MEEDVNPALLHIHQLPQGKGVPHMIEVPVHPDSAPYLVSTTKGWLWVEKPLKNGCVRAALRKSYPNDLFKEVLHEIIKASNDEDWGVVCPSLGSASERMSEYDLDEHEVLDRSEIGWINPGVQSVLVPVSRTFFGTVFISPGPQIMSGVVVHNASRGISVVLDGTVAP